MEQTTSCQIQGLNKQLWLKFRQIALFEGISAAAKIRTMVEEVVASTNMASVEKGRNNEG